MCEGGKGRVYRRGRAGIKSSPQATRPLGSSGFTPLKKSLSPVDTFFMIVVKLDRVLAERKVRLTDLARRVGIALPNLSLLKTGKVKEIRLALLDALCRELDCQPGDLLAREATVEPRPAAAASRNGKRPHAANVGIDFID